MQLWLRQLPLVAGVTAGGLTCLCWLHHKGCMYGKGGAGNGHLKLHFKPFGCQAVNAADPHLAENLIISHGLETGWAQAAPGIALGALGMVWGSIALSNIYLMKG